MCGELGVPALHVIVTAHFEFPLRTTTSKLGCIGAGTWLACHRNTFARVYVAVLNGTDDEIFSHDFTPILPSTLLNDGD
jgi:hypothetical protein